MSTITVPTTVAGERVKISKHDLLAECGAYYTATMTGDAAKANQILQSAGVLTAKWADKDRSATDAAHEFMMEHGKAASERSERLHAERVAEARAVAIADACEYWDTTLIVAAQRLTAQGYTVGGLTKASPQEAWYQWSADVYAERMATRGQDPTTIRTVADRIATELAAQ